MVPVRAVKSSCLCKSICLLQLSTDGQMLDFSRICVCLHRKMERREEDGEVKEETEEGCDDDSTEGDDDDDDDDEETAERSDNETKEERKGAKDVGKSEGSDGLKEQTEEGGEAHSVRKKASSCPGQKCVPGIIYLGHIPPRLRPKHLRNMLSPYGEVGRVFLQPEGRETSPLPCCPPTLWSLFFV